jgi:integrative and conjugative element protein (TIGR02256 family)
VSPAEGSPALAPGQQLAAGQLAEIADRSDGAVEILRGPYRPAAGQSVVIDIAMDCSGMPRAAAGVRLRARETFSLEISPAFPFTVPQVSVPHSRWAGTPHVQWQKVICLYAAPSVEWLPADGMRGLVDRLILWLRRAAAGELDPEGQPLHPPVAYATWSAGVAVVRPDLPAAAATPGTGAPCAARFMVAVCRQDRLDRADVIEWVTPAVWKMRYQSAELSGDVSDGGTRFLGAAAIMLGQDIGFEYPDNASALLAGLAKAGAGTTSLLGLLSTVAVINARLDAVLVGQQHEQVPRPLCLFVGTPSRRVPGSDRRLTHLVCWRLDQVGQQLLAAARAAGTDDRDLARATAAWLEQATTSWMPVMEARPEVTRRRDSSSSAAWLAGKRVLVLGCGALGAPAAEICARAGAAEVTVADNGVIGPGILVRQPYEDSDIGQFKALALTRRLNQIHADERVSALPQDVITMVLTDEMPASKFDLIIDAAANTAVTSRLEYCRAQSSDDWPAVLTMIIGHDARRGIVALARPGASGAGRDILRKLGLASCGDKAGQLADIRDDFFPESPRAEFFQPEPGCSDPTFTGSAAETGALAAHLMTAGLDALAGRAGPHADQPLSAAVVRLDAHDGPGADAGTRWLGWPDDAVAADQAGGYEVRLSPTAIREMRAESARGARVRGRGIETGGMLLGEIDDACRCIWIDVATGPPPDSRLSAWHFDHGTDGVQDLVDHHVARSRQITAFAGLWHTHPDHAAWPSPTDAAGMQQLLASAAQASPRALMIIIGGCAQVWSAWLHDGQLPEIYAGFVRHDPATSLQPPAVPAEHTKAAWPGGFAINGRGSRERVIPRPWAAWVRALIPRTRRKVAQR